LPQHGHWNPHRSFNNPESREVTQVYGNPHHSKVISSARLLSPDVQFREAENSWRLDHSHRGWHRRDISCLVDASDVRAVMRLDRSMSVMGYYQPIGPDGYQGLSRIIVSVLYRTLLCAA
jgi:hypothetical protein